MIQVTVWTENDKYVGLDIHGHAGYDEYGYDIVCSAVSVLSINLANSIEAFTENLFTCEMEEGDYHFRLIEEVGEDARLLLKSCVLGLQSIEQEYGSEYVKISMQEVK